MSSLDWFVGDIHTSKLVDGSYSAHRVPPRTKTQILFLLMGYGPPRGVMAVLGVAGLAVKPGISSCDCFGSCLVVAPHLLLISLTAKQLN